MILPPDTLSACLREDCTGCSVDDDDLLENVETPTLVGSSQTESCCSLMEPACSDIGCNGVEDLLLKTDASQEEMFPIKVESSQNLALVPDEDNWSDSFLLVVDPYRDDASSVPDNNGNEGCEEFVKTYCSSQISKCAFGSSEDTTSHGPRKKRSLSTCDVLGCYFYPLQSKHSSTPSIYTKSSVPTVNSLSVGTLSATKSRDSGIARSVSCTSLSVRSGSYDHVQSKVKEYIRQIKIANATDRSMAAFRRCSSPIILDRQCCVFHLPNKYCLSESSLQKYAENLSSEKLLTLLLQERKELQEKEKLLEELQENYDNLLTKYAEAENKIDQLRFSKLMQKADSGNMVQCSTPSRSSLRNDFDYRYAYGLYQQCIGQRREVICDSKNTVGENLIDMSSRVPANSEYFAAEEDDAHHNDTASDTRLEKVKDEEQRMEGFAKERLLNGHETQEQESQGSEVLEHISPVFMDLIKADEDFISINLSQEERSVGESIRHENQFVNILDNACESFSLSENRGDDNYSSLHPSSRDNSTVGSKVITSQHNGANGEVVKSTGKVSRIIQYFNNTATESIYSGKSINHSNREKRKSHGSVCSKGSRSAVPSEVTSVGKYEIHSSRSNYVEQSEDCIFHNVDNDEGIVCNEEVATKEDSIEESICKLDLCAGLDQLLTHSVPEELLNQSEGKEKCNDKCGDAKCAGDKINEYSPNTNKDSLNLGVENRNHQLSQSTQYKSILSTSKDHVETIGVENNPSCPLNGSFNDDMTDRKDNMKTGNLSHKILEGDCNPVNVDKELHNGDLEKMSHSVEGDSIEDIHLPSDDTFTKVKRWQDSLPALETAEPTCCESLGSNPDDHKLPIFVRTSVLKTGDAVVVKSLSKQNGQNTFDVATSPVGRWLEKSLSEDTSFSKENFKCQKSVKKDRIKICNNHNCCIKMSQVSKSPLSLSEDATDFFEIQSESVDILKKSLHNDHSCIVETPIRCNVMCGSVCPNGKSIELEEPGRDIIEAVSSATEETKMSSRSYKTRSISRQTSSRSSMYHGKREETPVNLASREIDSQSPTLEQQPTLTSTPVSSLTNQSCSPIVPPLNLDILSDSDPTYDTGTDTVSKASFLKTESQSFSSTHPRSSTKVKKSINCSYFCDRSCCSHNLNVASSSTPSAISYSKTNILNDLALGSKDSSPCFQQSLHQSLYTFRPYPKTSYQTGRQIKSADYQRVGKDDNLRCFKNNLKVPAAVTVRNIASFGNEISHTSSSSYRTIVPFVKPSRKSIRINKFDCTEHLARFESETSTPSKSKCLFSSPRKQMTNDFSRSASQFQESNHEEHSLQKTMSDSCEVSVERDQQRKSSLQLKEGHCGTVRRKKSLQSQVNVDHFVGVTEHASTQTGSDPLPKSSSTETLSPRKRHKKRKKSDLLHQSRSYGRKDTVAENSSSQVSDSKGAYSHRLVNGSDVFDQDRISVFETLDAADQFARQLKARSEVILRYLALQLDNAP